TQISRGCGRPIRRFFREHVRTGCGVGLARLFHPLADDSLAVFVARHRLVSSAHAAGSLPDNAHAATQRLTMRIREYAPLCLTTDPGRGGTSRGLAWIDATVRMRQASVRRQAISAVTAGVDSR